MSLTEPAIVARSLELRYGQATALAPSTFGIPNGTITAIIGPNGSGKSTLLNAIAGLIAPTSGSIDVPGATSPTAIAYVLQSTRVNQALPVTVREVVSMGRYATRGAYGRLGTEDRDAVNTAMERIGITDIATKHLDELSGGQRQRVFVAQGLAQEHTVLLLDEPLTGIDLAAAQAIDAVIHDESKRGCTVIMTTHDLSEAQYADHVLLLSGRVVASGRPDDVLTRDNLINAYGTSLLHVDEGGQLFLDDPAHTHLPGRHSHRERTIHTEPLPDDLHGHS
ncbi:MAG: zinc ABC transporter ATP-binding protein AztA [Acidimicrobiia bacterium]